MTVGDFFSVLLFFTIYISYLQMCMHIVRPQSIDCLVRVSFAIKNEAGGPADGNKKVQIF